jgi:hypothetical protein
VTVAACAPLARRSWPTIPQVFIGGEFVVRLGERNERTKMLLSLRRHAMVALA